jgi:hypothetical protein
VTASQARASTASVTFSSAWKHSSTAIGRPRRERALRAGPIAGEWHEKKARPDGRVACTAAASRPSWSLSSITRVVAD